MCNSLCACRLRRQTPACIGRAKWSTRCTARSSEQLSSCAAKQSTRGRLKKARGFMNNNAGDLQNRVCRSYNGPCPSGLKIIPFYGSVSSRLRFGLTALCHLSATVISRTSRTSPIRQHLLSCGLLLEPRICFRSGRAFADYFERH